MMDKPNKGIWQIGFYDPGKERMVTFIIQQDVLKVSEETEVLKKPGAPITELKPEEVKISVEKALQIADELRKEKYPDNEPVKQFFIIQHLEKAPIFNITFVTQKFATLNIKIDTRTGKVLKHELSSLGDLGKVF